VLAAGAFYFSKFNTPLVHSALNGATAAAVGLTLANAVELTAETGKRPLNLIFIAATAVAVTYFRLSLVLTLLLFGGLSMALYARTSRKAAAPKR
jgi:chromate transport protein ChrA